MNVLAFDIGGTRTKAGVVDASGSVSLRLVEPTAPDAQGVLAAIERIGKEIAADHEAVAACVPGLVDEHGTVVSLPGKLPGMEGLDLRERLARTFGVRALVTNDAIAYATGEATFGAGRGMHRVVVVTIGTGVGVSVIERGSPVGTGPLGGGILGGFIPIDAAQGPLDSNGGTGTIEALCAARRITDYANAAGGSFERPEDVVSAASQDDAAARNGVDRYRGYLERALVALAHAHAPDSLIVGGGPMTTGTPLLDGIEESVNAALYGSYHLTIRVAELGDDAALAGLGALATGGP